MVCSNCGYVLGPDDQYCGGCGAFLTDAPASEAGQDQPVAAAPGDPGLSDPQRDIGPEDTPWGIPYAPAEPPPPPRSGLSGRLIAAAVAAVALVAFLLFWVLRPEGEPSLASGSATTGASATADATSAGAGTATETATPTPTDTPSTPPTQTEIELPGSAEPCNNVGAFVVYRGNTTTSCPFAENVGRAFAEVDQPVTSQVALSAVSSPVTGLDYDLTCEFTAPVRCTGGDNAVVYLVPAS